MGLPNSSWPLTEHQLATLLELALAARSMGETDQSDWPPNGLRDRSEAGSGCSRSHPAAARNGFVSRYRLWSGFSGLSSRNFTPGLSCDAGGIPRAAASLSAAGHSTARAARTSEPNSAVPRSLEPSLHTAADLPRPSQSPADALPLLLPWVEPGGWLLFPGSTPAPHCSKG